MKEKLSDVEALGFHSEYSYPPLVDRIKATLFDFVLIILALMTFANVLDIHFAFSDSERGEIAHYILLSIFLYEPIMISFLGGTLGHFAAGIRVKYMAVPNKNLHFHFAMIRTLLKLFLGWISLLTVTNTLNKRAIHDLATGSVVVNK